MQNPGWMLSIQLYCFHKDVRGKQCRPGYFAASATTEDCLPCPRGTWQSEAGSSSCHNCTHIIPGSTTLELATAEAPFRGAMVLCLPRLLYQPRGRLNAGQRLHLPAADGTASARDRSAGIRVSFKTQIERQNISLLCLLRVSDSCIPPAVLLWKHLPKPKAILDSFGLGAWPLCARRRRVAEGPKFRSQRQQRGL